MYSPFVRCGEKVNYEQRLRSIVGAHLALGSRPFPTRLSNVGVFSRPYEQLNFITNWSQWAKHVDL